MVYLTISLFSSTYICDIRKVDYSYVPKDWLIGF